MNDTSLNSFKLTRTPSALKVFAAVWAIVLTSSLIFIIVTPWTQSVQGTGVVTALSPMLRPQTVSAGFDARLVAWKVREGEKVVEGQIVAELAEYRPEYLDPQQLVRAQSQRNAVALKRQAAEAQLRSYDSLLAALRQVGNARPDTSTSVAASTRRS
jgi:multidrug efflux pump subunit AcrA (membrane-fusion protein)